MNYSRGKFKELERENRNKCEYKDDKKIIKSGNNNSQYIGQIKIKIKMDKLCTSFLFSHPTFVYIQIHGLSLLQQYSSHKENQSIQSRNLFERFLCFFFS